MAVLLFPHGRARRVIIMFYGLKKKKSFHRVNDTMQT